MIGSPSPADDPFAASLMKTRRAILTWQVSALIPSRLERAAGPELHELTRTTAEYGIFRHAEPLIVEERSKYELSDAPTSGPIPLEQGSMGEIAEDLLFGRATKRWGPDRMLIADSGSPRAFAVPIASVVQPSV